MSQTNKVKTCSPMQQEIDQKTREIRDLFNWALYHSAEINTAFHALEELKNMDKAIKELKDMGNPTDPHSLFQRSDWQIADVRRRVARHAAILEQSETELANAAYRIVHGIPYKRDEETAQRFPFLRQWAGIRPNL